MPPKCKAKKDAKKDVKADPFAAKIAEMEAEDDGTNIPKHAVVFKMQFEIVQQDIENHFI